MRDDNLAYGRFPVSVQMARGQNCWSTEIIRFENALSAFGQGEDAFIFVFVPPQDNLEISVKPVVPTDS